MCPSEATIYFTFAFGTASFVLMAAHITHPDYFGGMTSAVLTFICAEIPLLIVFISYFVTHQLLKRFLAWFGLFLFFADILFYILHELDNEKSLLIMMGTSLVAGIIFNILMAIIIYSCEKYENNQAVSDDQNNTLTNSSSDTPYNIDDSIWLNKLKNQNI